MKYSGRVEELRVESKGSRVQLGQGMPCPFFQNAYVGTVLTVHLALGEEQTILLTISIKPIDWS